MSQTKYDEELHFFQEKTPYNIRLCFVCFIIVFDALKFQPELTVYFCVLSFTHGRHANMLFLFVHRFDTLIVVESLHCE